MMIASLRQISAITSQLTHFLLTIPACILLLETSAHATNLLMIPHVATMGKKKKKKKKKKMSALLLLFLMATFLMKKDLMA
eukprot:5428939-Prymnesium_polylepis.1